ncbi:MAG: TetR/AcrR family transcriptional regulator [Bacillaceae bacterium]|nr:TetR/AcrR family transcriptional regulator [Bacillaceae bacterium]
MTLIEQQGYEKTSVSQIVKETGIAQGTFYLYFKTKSEIDS